MEQSDVVVVGGGIAGLTVAAECARAGLRVLLLEAAPEFGGRARTTTLHEGYFLNFGPRALYRGRALRVLRRNGVRPRGAAPASGLALLGGELHRGFLDAPGLLRTPLLSARERASLLAMLATAGRGRGLAGRSALDWLTDRLPSARAVSVAQAMARVATYVGALDTISADAVATHLGLARWGVRYVDGGWGRLADGMCRAAATHGAQVRTGSRVVAVDPGRRRVRVELRDREVTARSVVLAGLAPREVARLLPGPAAPAVGPVLSASCLDVALSRLPRPQRPFVVGLDEPVYLSVHSASARLAPDGGAVVHVLRYHGQGSTAAGHRAELERLLDAVQPGWREVLVHARFLPRIRVCGALPRPDGYGLAGRTATAAADRAGVFLAGDWVGPHGLLLEASLASAQDAARAAARYATAC